MGKKPIFLTIVDDAVQQILQDNADAIDTVNTSLANTTDAVNTSLADTTDAVNTSLTNTTNTVNSNLTTANNKVDAMAILLEDDLNYTTFARDVNGNAQETHYKRADNSLYRKIVGSNPTADGNYQAFTMTEYDTDGITVVITKQRTVTYTAEGKLDTRSKWAVI